MPSVSDLTNSICVVFASGTAEVNRAMLDRFRSQRADLPLAVVSEFEPAFGEWIPWHVQRTFEQNLVLVKTALAGRQIVAAAVAYDQASALGDLHRAARTLAPGVLTAFDEELRVAAPADLRGFLIRRAGRRITRQLLPGGRIHAWLRRIIHPSEAEIPIRARLAQARGLTARRTRKAVAPRAQEFPVNPDGVTIVIPSRDGLELLREMLAPLLPQIGQGEVIVVNNGSSDGTADWLASEYP